MEKEKKRQPYAIILFQRNLRLIDNTILFKCVENMDADADTGSKGTILPLFCFDPRQITNKNKYKSSSAIQFMIESIEDLQQEIKNKKGKLYIAYGLPHNIIHTILKDHQSIRHVYVQKDITPFSAQRNEQIQNICDRMNVQLYTYWDDYLTEPNTILTGAGTTYKVFKPFYEKARKIPIASPRGYSHSIVYYQPTSARTRFSWEISETTYNKIVNNIIKNNKNKQMNILHQGGRTNALQVLKKINTLKNYDKTRNDPSVRTSQLSAYIKFGCISIREAYREIKKYNITELLRQLYWRDFYAAALYSNPDVLLKSQAYQSDWDTIYKLPTPNKKYWETWCRGTTGIPIIDAGMRQMLITGYMHNRVRMLVASILYKNMGLPWQWGEKFFAQHLYDYDPASNTGGWQTVNGMGVAPLEWFRVMNPWTQQKKFDKECTYIYQWIPELKTVPPKDIHTWYKNYEKYPNIYMPPVIDIDISRKAFMARFKGKK